MEKCKENQFRQFATPCPHYLSEIDTHMLSVVCLGVEHARYCLLNNHQQVLAVPLARWMWEQLSPTCVDTILTTVTSLK